jgi:hyperosmotically inducible protein
MQRFIVLLFLAAAVAACDRTPPVDSKAVAGPAPAPSAVSADVKNPPAVDPQVARDKELAARVQAVLAESSGLNAKGVDVTASNGQISLFGTTPTERQRRALEKLAAGVAGVTSVRNEIKVIQGS